MGRPHFPHMWLAELADGGRHVDASVFVEFRRVLGTLAAIWTTGRSPVCSGRHPFVVQLGIVALMFFARPPPCASAPGRCAAGSGRAGSGDRHQSRAGLQRCRC
jgi:hypothetical protein